MVVKHLTIDTWVKRHAAHQPTKPAMHFEGLTWNYQNFSSWIEELASALQNELELKRGDRVSYYGKNSDTEVALFFASARLGLIIVPLNWRLSAIELNHIIADCGAKILFHDGKLTQHLPAILLGLSAQAISAENHLKHLTDKNKYEKIITYAVRSDPLFIVYTSGTTGTPKGAVITQEAIFWNAIMSIHAHDLSSTDHTLNILPLFHIGGINIQMMPSFFIGAQITLHTGFDPEATLNSLENEGITTTVCVPTVMKALSSHPKWDNLTLPKLRLFNTGSTDVPIEIIEANHSRGIPMIQVYGATETGPISTYQTPSEAFSTVGSIGRCGIHTQIKLIQENGEEAPLGHPGEIWVKGPNNFSYYWNNQEATDEALVDGWFRTGDIATLDGGGLYWFRGRLKHIIISGGENIHPAEIERLLNKIPGIIESAVVGRSDPTWGEVPIAVVVCKDAKLDSKTIMAFLVDQIAKFKLPKEIIFLETLPRNTMGKIQVDELRKLIQQ